MACSNISFLDEEVEIEILSELQDCEEQNFHYRVVNVKSGKGISKGELVLPELIDELNTATNNKLLFPDKIDSSGFTILVRGRLSKEGHSRDFEGCMGSHVLQIIEIMK